MLAVAQNTDLDRGATKVADRDERLCAVSRTVKPVAEMIRFVVGPDDDVVPDIKRKLPGRGIWITGTRATVADAVRRGVFARGFKRTVRADASLPDRVGHLLERSALDALAMAGKAGNVVTGFGKVEEATGHARLAAILEASDGAADGKRKILQALRRHSGERTRSVPIIGFFSSGQLDLALTGLNVVHAALLDGPVSETFLSRAVRYERYRDDNLNDVSKERSEDMSDVNAPIGAAEDKERNE